MVRLARFIREFIVGARELSGVAQVVLATVFFFLPLIGFTVAQFTDVLHVAAGKPWSFWLLIPPVVWVSARAGGAAERSMGPIIWTAKNLNLDRYWMMLEWKFENRGNDEVTARVFADHLYDRNGVELPRFDSGGVELCWRGQVSDSELTLFGRKTGKVGVLVLDNTRYKPPRLLLVMPPSKNAPPGFFHTSELFTDPILPQQEGGFYLTLRIEFRKDGKPVKDKRRSFFFAPDPQAEMKIRPRPVSWIPRSKPR